MSMYNIKSRIIIEYERTAFTYPLGNMRVMLDRNIYYSKDIKNFLDRLRSIKDLYSVCLYWPMMVKLDFN